MIGKQVGVKRAVMNAKMDGNVMTALVTGTSDGQRIEQHTQQIQSACMNRRSLADTGLLPNRLNKFVTRRNVIYVASLVTAVNWWSTTTIKQDRCGAFSVIDAISGSVIFAIMPRCCMKPLGI